MNHIYHSIWNDALGAWIAVSEIASGQGKRSSNRRKNPMTASPLKDWQSSTPLLATSLLLFSSASWALPTGNELIAGQATVNTPSAGQMQIDQASQQAVINWQGFSIAPTEAVNIQQPNAQAALLNRVVGADASQIQGQLHANGQVYLVNPNGVLFGKTAQVDVGGLIASTHEISNADFMAGKNHFTQNGATGTVENHGTINVPNGGVVALISSSVTNTGNINTPKGTTALAAGKTVDLDFVGDGLVEVKVSEAALNAQITNKGAIQADGGRVVLTAKAAGQLIDTVINQQGIIKAQGLIERNGEIILDGGDNGTVQVSGTLNADGQTGGNISVTGNNIQINNGAVVTASGDNGGGVITIGDKVNTSQTSIAQGATVSANSKQQGDAGTVNILADMNKGTVNVAGQVNAVAVKQGNGGFIDTSAAHVKVANTAKISTKATNGNAGTWLIDPPDFTIASTGGDITGATLSTNLGGGNVIITSSSGTIGGVNGDINVNDTVNWAANKLTLNAQRNININSVLNGSGTAQLALLYGQASAAGGATDDYFINSGGKVNLAAGQNFSTQKGSNIANLKTYTVITDLGVQGDATGGINQTLQGIARTANLSGLYVLGADINATATSGWNTGAGFVPIGKYFTPAANPFMGIFDGLGHSISSLTINSPIDIINNIGLFGDIGVGSVIRNVGLINANVAALVAGAQYTGALVGWNNGGFVSNSYVTGGSITSGSSYLGGLVGYNDGTISNSYAAVRVIGLDSVGGLVGFNTVTISNSYATGNVTGTNNNVGGLVGGTDGGTISNSYATGSVTGALDSVGGLVGYHGSSTITNSYATGNVQGTTSVGGLVGTNNVASTISSSFWNTQTQTHGVTATVGTDNGTTTNSTGKTTAQMKQLATFSGAGWDIASTGGSTAVWRIYEGNTTPLLRSFLTPLTVAASSFTKTYNGLSDSSTYTNPTTGAAIGAAITPYTNTTTGAAITPSTNLLGSATFYDTAKNVGIYTASTTGLFSNQQGYDISNGTGTLTITPATLTYTANAASRLYGAANPTFSGTVTGFVNRELLANVTTGTASYSSLATKTSNVGTYLVSGSGLLANFGNYIFVQAPSNSTALTIKLSDDIKPVVKPSDDVIPEIEREIEHKTVIQVNVLNLNFNFWLSQLMPLQVSTTFLGQYYEKHAHFNDYVDADYGQYKNNDDTSTTVNYQWHQDHGKKHWYDKKHDHKNTSFYTALLYILEKNGIKLPVGLLDNLKF